MIQKSQSSADSTNRRLFREQGHLALILIATFLGVYRLSGLCTAAYVQHSGPVPVSIEHGSYLVLRGWAMRTYRQLGHTYRRRSPCVRTNQSPSTGLSWPQS